MSSNARAKARMNWRDTIVFVLCGLAAAIAAALALMGPSDKSYAYIFVTSAIIAYAVAYAFARTPNKHASKTKDASMPITLDLTFCENTPENRRRCLRPGHLYLTIYPKAKNISRSIYRGEENPQWGWSANDTQPFTSHIPLDGPAFFTEGEVENIPGFPGWDNILNAKSEE